MFTQLRIGLLMLVIFSAITGILYPLAVTGIAQLVFPTQANGSLIETDGRTMGSALIGQPFSDPKYFWGRISATTPFPYNGQGSTGSNLGPTNPALLDQVKARIVALKAADPAQAAPIPVDLVTASGSGLDPEISPAAADYQVGRVARARHLNEDAVRALVQKYTTNRQLGFLGEPRINVLELNLALDAAK
ncbi:MAG TPA: potassium-transporting ATPase subunit KdpC [Gammaproteobacteria bacterium]|nr:potassium-transporting ATPase subunit KdpC [Gammaproteobacteria bacterium]